ncbi:hypothetical protein [Deinococcus sonorensis]|uniref:Uncharacterized protein n=1 Tax=Deinococcus sonorensis TaxID=309891 RepID=A0ABV8YAJ5_9DEIO
MQVELSTLPPDRLVSGSRWRGMRPLEPGEVHLPPSPAEPTRRLPLRMQFNVLLLGLEQILLKLMMALLVMVLIVIKVAGVVTVVALVGLTGHQLAQALHTANILDIFKLVGWGVLDASLLPSVCGFTFNGMPGWMHPWTRRNA